MTSRWRLGSLAGRWGPVRTMGNNTKGGAQCEQETLSFSKRTLKLLTFSMG
jgi:hypothetical protein